MNYGYDMAMPIERSNSFHLMLSDDELALLRMLAEQEGLNASDYLRSLMRRAAGGGHNVNLSRIRELVHLLAPEVDLATLWSGQAVVKKATEKRPPGKKKRKAGP